MLLLLVLLLGGSKLAVLTNLSVILGMFAVPIMIAEKFPRIALVAAVIIAAALVAGIVVYFFFADDALKDLLSKSMLGLFIANVIGASLLSYLDIRGKE